MRQGKACRILFFVIRSQNRLNGRAGKTPFNGRLSETRLARCIGQLIAVSFETIRKVIHENRSPCCCFA